MDKLIEIKHSSGSSSWIRASKIERISGRTKEITCSNSEQTSYANVTNIDEIVKEINFIDANR